MTRFGLLVAFLAMVVAVALARPQSDYRLQPPPHPLVHELRKADGDGPIKITQFSQSISPEGSDFSYVDDQGNSRSEKIVMETVKDGDNEAVVPFATGTSNHVSPDGTKIVMSYSAGRGGNTYSWTWNAQN